MRQVLKFLRSSECFLLFASAILILALQSIVFIVNYKQRSNRSNIQELNLINIYICSRPNIAKLVFRNNILEPVVML